MCRARLRTMTVREGRAHGHGDPSARADAAVRQSSNLTGPRPDFRDRGSTRLRLIVAPGPVTVRLPGSPAAGPARRRPGGRPGTRPGCHCHGDGPVTGTQAVWQATVTCRRAPLSHGAASAIRVARRPLPRWYRIIVALRVQ